MNPQKTMETALEIDYNLKPALRTKYAEMLVNRAVRFYIENTLDSSVVDEDLIPFCSVCGDELTMDTEEHFNPEEAGHKEKVEYCNLDHSIEHETKYQQDLSALNKNND